MVLRHWIAEDRLRWVSTRDMAERGLVCGSVDFCVVCICQSLHKCIQALFDVWRRIVEGS